MSEEPVAPQRQIIDANVGPHAPQDPPNTPPESGQLFLPEPEVLDNLPRIPDSDLDSQIIFLPNTKSEDSDDAHDPLEEFRERSKDPIHRMEFNHALAGLSEQSVVADALKAAVLRAQELTRENQMLKDKLLRDPLTKLYNIEGLRQKGEELHKAGRPMGVIFLDLDRFKPVNDKIGHDAGDKALISMAGVIARSVRDGDYAGRIGGDEFVVLVDLSMHRPEFSSDQTNKIETPESVIEKLKIRLQAHFELFLATRPELSAAGLNYSIGYGLGPTFDEAKVKADVAMRKIKDQKDAAGLSVR